eukprot:757100-Hanusia_phi.AAC.2
MHGILVFVAFFLFLTESTAQSTSPGFCDSVTRVTGTFGTISLGPYQNNLKCGWIVEPPNAISIDLTIDFSTEYLWDYIDVYYYVEASNMLVRALPASLSGTQTQRLTIKTSKIFIYFFSDSSVTFNGFDITFSATTSSSGCSLWSLSFPGSMDFQKDLETPSSANCVWFVAANNANSSRRTRAVANLFDRSSGYPGSFQVSFWSCSDLVVVGDVVVITPMDEGYVLQARKTSMDAGDEIFFDTFKGLIELSYRHNSYEPNSPTESLNVETACTYISMLAPSQQYCSSCGINLESTNVNPFNCFPSSLLEPIRYAGNVSYFTRSNGFYSSFYDAYSFNNGYRRAQHFKQTSDSITKNTNHSSGKNTVGRDLKQSRRSSMPFHVNISYGTGCPSGQVLHGNVCEKCPINTYTYRSACVPCSNVSFTAQIGSPYCLCQDGYLFDSQANDCVACPSGKFIMKENLIVIQPYWSWVDSYDDSIYAVLMQAIQGLQFQAIEKESLASVLLENPRQVILPSFLNINNQDTWDSLKNYVANGGIVILLEVLIGHSEFTNSLGIYLNYDWSYDTSSSVVSTPCFANKTLDYAACITDYTVDNSDIQFTPLFQGINYPDSCMTGFKADYKYGTVIGITWHFGYYSETWSKVLKDIVDLRNTNAGSCLSQNSCSTCPPGKSAAGARSSVSDCQCDLGRTKSAWTNECVPCPSGSYKSWIGDSACSPCPSNSVTLTDGATGRGSCLCLENYFPDGNGCSQCLANTFKNSIGNEVCTGCPTNSDASCQCNAGYQGSSCTACVAGTYKSARGSGPCQPCPASRNSSAGATSLSACQCVERYTLGADGECQLCAAGKYKNFVGNSACLACPNTTSSQTGNSLCSCDVGFEPKGSACALCGDGYYKSVLENSTCKACPQGYVSAPDRKSCVCDVGYGIASPSQGCLACIEGQYKMVKGNMSCSSCPANSITTYTGATSVNHCVCRKGYTNSSVLRSCIPCQAGKYKAVNANSTCTACNANSNSSEGSDDPIDCKCNGGYGKILQTPSISNSFRGDFSTHTCDTCPQKTYSRAGDDQCRDCPRMSTSLPGSDDILKCQCGINYYASLSSLQASPGSADLPMQCLACDAGKYSNPGAFTCKPCSICDFGKIESGSCPDVKCDACSSSQFYDAFTRSCLPCRKCTGGIVRNCSSFQDSICREDLSGCLPCGKNEYLSSRSPCTCTPCTTCSMGQVLAGCGRFSNDSKTFSNGNCVDCRIGFYGSGGSAESCVLCPAGHYSARDGNSVCTQCAAGSYSEQSSGSSTCFTCPPNSMSSAGSESCSCMRGYMGINDQCTACPAGQYSTESGQSFCTSCPAFQTTLSTASISILACTCVEGYTLNGEECVACAGGKYKSTKGTLGCSTCGSNQFSSSGASACSNCLANTVSLPGSSQCTCAPGFESTSPSSSQCVPCRPGRYSNTFTSSCTPCPAGTYATEPASTYCTTCPLNSDSAPGSSSMANCSCRAGYTGEGFSCRMCPAGTFKTGRGNGACSSCSPPSNCSIGFYKPECMEGSATDPPCLPCTIKPAFSSYTSNGEQSDSCSFKCDGGYQYNCQTNECQVCSPDLEYYSPADEACKACPTGASCDGRNLAPLVPGSVWEIYNGNYRVSSCPAGYVLVRDNREPLLDECVLCPTNYYSPVPSSFDTGVQRVLSAAEVLSKCIACSLDKVDCPGGSRQIAKAGFWTLDSIQSRRKSGDQALHVPVYRCAPGACDAGNNCTIGRTGVLCALCDVGYAVTGTSYGKTAP